MATTVARLESNAQMEEYIVNLLKSKKGDKVNGNDICESLGILSPKKNSIMLKLRQKYPQIAVNRGGRGAQYAWIEKIPPKPVVKPLDNVMKNAEKYSDPTAGKAITNVDKEIEREAKLPKPGEVWECCKSAGGVDIFLVVWSSAASSSAMGIYLNAVVDGNLSMSRPMAGSSCVYIRLDKTMYVGDAIQIGGKPVRYMTKSIGTVDELIFSQIKNALLKVLNIKVPERIVEKVVEKPVEKIVEKPVDRIVYRDRPVKEKPADIFTEERIAKLQTEIDKLQIQICIYKDIIDRLAPRKN